MVRSQPRSDNTNARKSHVTKWGHVSTILDIREWILDDVEHRIWIEDKGKNGQTCKGTKANPVVVSDDEDSEVECIGTVHPTYNCLSVDFAPDD